MPRLLFQIHFVLVFLGPFFTGAEDFSSLPIRRIASDKGWRNLLHAKKSFWGEYYNQSDSKDFFLSPNGAVSPESELVENLKQFLITQVGEGSLDKHPGCLFPARFRYLQRQLQTANLKWPKLRCPSFESFKSRINAKSVSVVFSSYYLNNPSSSFGHLLLRFNKSPQDLASESDRFELLDFGVNYAATIDTDNPFVYGFKGLFGFFSGQFTIQHYYYKVREYNDFESRDLWSYELNLTDDELERLVEHIWEMGSNHYPYYYLTQNCAYHILSAIEGAAPQFELTERLPIYVIPSDSLKVLANTPGLVRHIHYRPSPRSSFYYRLSLLSNEQSDLLAKVIDDHQRSTLQMGSEAVDVLDTAIDYMDYRHAKELLKKDAFATKSKQDVLVMRSKIPIISRALDIRPQKKEMPHAGHESMRVGADYGYTNDRGSSLGVNARFALHDLLDPQAGYPDYAQIEFLSIFGRYHFERKDLWLEELNLFQVKSLSPLTRFDQLWSWRFRLGAKTIRDKNCAYCLAGTVDGGYGVSGSWGGITAYFFPDLEGSTTPDFIKFPARFGIGPTAGLRFQWPEDLQCLFEAGYRYYFLSHFSQTYFLSANARYGLSKNLAIDLKAQRFQVEFVTTGGLFYYF